MDRRSFFKVIGGTAAAFASVLGLGAPRHIRPLALAQEDTIKWGSCIEVAGGGQKCRDYYNDTRSDAPCKSVCFEVEVPKTTAPSCRDYSCVSDCVCVGCFYRSRTKPKSNGIRKLYEQVKGIASRMKTTC